MSRVRAYIVNALLGVNTVSVVDTETNTIIATIPVGNTPQGVGFDNITCVTRVYITNYDSNTVSVIDADTNTVIATIPVGANPVGALSVQTEHGTFVYITNSGDNTISVINVETNLVVTTIASPQFSFSQAMSTCQCSNRFIYVSNSGTNTVSVIDTSTDTVLTGIGYPIVVGNGPAGIATTPNCLFVYVANVLDGNVSKISTQTNTVVGLPITVGTFPFGVTITPDGAFVYVVNNGTEDVSVIRVSDGTVVATIPLPYTQALGSAITPDGRFVYVTDNSNNVAGDGKVDVIDTSNNTVITSITGFSNPVSFGLFIATLCDHGGGGGGVRLTKKFIPQTTLCFKRKYDLRGNILPCPPRIMQFGYIYTLTYSDSKSCCYQR